MTVRNCHYSPSHECKNVRVLPFDVSIALFIDSPGTARIRIICRLFFGLHKFAIRCTDSRSDYVLLFSGVYKSAITPA